MSFMEPEVYEGRVIELVDAETLATYYVPASDVESNPAECVPSGTLAHAPIEHEHMVVGRLSAPGYLDCTDWEPFNTVEEAEAELATAERDAFGEDEDEDDTFDDED